jgi:transglutaminase-like putative cysteine protease
MIRPVRFGSLLFALILIFCMANTVTAGTAEDALARAARLEVAGDFAGASNVLNQALATTPSSSQREQIAFELDRMYRIDLDFPMSEADLYAALQQSVSGLTTNEFAQWLGEGRFDSRVIDGRRWFMRASVSNLYFRYPGLDPRRQDGGDKSTGERLLLDYSRAIKQAALRQGTPYVLPMRFDITMTVTVDADAAPAGQIVRAWLPIPRVYPYQGYFEVVTSTPTVKEIAPEDSSIRSAYFEQPAVAGQPTVFSLNYRYTHYGVWFDIDPKKVMPATNAPALAPYLREAPHVVFTPEMRALSRQIVGDEKNPAIIAKRIYDWIGSNTFYSYSIEYSTIRNISDYCRLRSYGDCGQEAMLFITLCRLNGIPARWQSGWHTFTGFMTIHDWAEMYLAPYGWMPVDPYMSVMTSHYGKSLTPAERHEIHDFYFGGLDQWRIAANCDHSQLLTPPKNTYRADNVDFQRGEVESGNQNIYFDKREYNLVAQEIPLPDGKR